MEAFKAFVLEGGFEQAEDQGEIPEYVTGVRYFIRMLYISFGALAQDLDRVLDRVPVVSLLPPAARYVLVASLYLIPMALMIKYLFFDDI